MVVKPARSLRALVIWMARLFCIAILVSVAVESGGGRTTATPPMAAATVGNLVRPEGSSRGRPMDRMNSDPFFSNKRRVPNGPDPIHNRRAGKSGRPPGRA